MKPPARWLLLIHQVPPKPDYLRVKVRRRLHQIGAVALKSSVYVLPHTDEAVEDFQWLLNEIVAEDGDATICSASFLSGVSDEDIESLFRAQSAAGYVEIAERAATLRADAPDLQDQLSRLRNKLEFVAARDFFSAPERKKAEKALEASAADRSEEKGSSASPGPADAPTGATWVTRKGVFVDRIASAWLIRRFIDRDARFRFVGANEKTRPGELRFDMYRGEFTHVGESCTFETLLTHFKLDDPGLQTIGEIVHDIDCKDEKFGRGETAGILAVIKGIALATDDDEERLNRGASLFDDLYNHLS